MKSTQNNLLIYGKGTNRLLECRVLLSPLSGVTDQVFRNLVRRWAPEALLFTEMVNASTLRLGHENQRLQGLINEKGPIGVQLFDYRPEAMADAAKKSEEAGAFLIDINMGCPVKKITTKGGGSSLIQNPKLARKIIQSVVDSVKIPVTVKTRLGWANLGNNPVEWCKLLEDSGAKLLTLHGRTREQGFTGKADWNAIAKVKEALQIPLIANGDINSPSDALNCLAATKADGVMIGRGTMGAPWLVGQIASALKGLPIPKTPNTEEKLSIAIEQLESLVKMKGDHGLLIARKHMSWTCRHVDGATELRNSLMHAKNPKEAINLLKRKIESIN